MIEYKSFLWQIDSVATRSLRVLIPDYSFLGFFWAKPQFGGDDITCESNPTFEGAYPPLKAMFTGLANGLMRLHCAVSTTLRSVLGDR